MADVVDGISQPKPAQASEMTPSDLEQYKRQQAIKAGAFGLAGASLVMSQFPKAMAAQKAFGVGKSGFVEQAYKFIAKVRVHLGKQSFTDEVKGLNPGHAVARARMNWEGAVIEYLGPGTP